MSRSHFETHQTARIGWLRAAVLGANDGIISTACLMLGVLATGASPKDTLLTGVTGLVAGAMSMAAGEYISVQSQADTEAADLAKETAELAADPLHEQAELAAIYRTRGLDAQTAILVAQQLMAHDALGAHARDELGITEQLQAKPIQAATSSAIAFISGAFLPIMTTLALGLDWFKGLALSADTLLLMSTLVYLGLLGTLAAKAGGAFNLKAVGVAALRVMVWGALAMGVSIMAGQFFKLIIYNLTT